MTKFEYLWFVKYIKLYLFSTIKCTTILLDHFIFDELYKDTPYILLIIFPIYHRFTKVVTSLAVINAQTGSTLETILVQNILRAN